MRAARDASERWPRREGSVVTRSFVERSIENDLKKSLSLSVTSFRNESHEQSRSGNGASPWKRSRGFVSRGEAIQRGTLCAPEALLSVSGKKQKRGSENFVEAHLLLHFLLSQRKFAPSLIELFSNLSTMAENGAPDAASAAADVSYVLPEKWTEDTVDEKGEKMSKT